ncbi:helix-turn-helix domain-containing protein [Delftia acidovorans]|uniref:helix-turn-helix domain-containing protein n=1 Tax=Delftia acidovorans TaxID=80866 RepID=UPI0022ABB800|nr:helix-turn-helix domain-containing protein [Delftia acidovorans]WAT87624.1 helix-turn-helix domain-containing protein [Delftia acidovorans]
MRSLQLSCSQRGVGTFVDSIEHALVGDHPAMQLQQRMLGVDAQRVSLISISERIGELLAVDLNPFGQMLRLATTDASIKRAWDVYNDLGNVVSKVGFEGEKSYTANVFDNHCSSNEKIVVLSVHEKLRAGLHGVLINQLRKNQNEAVRKNRLEDSKVSTVSRIFGAGQIILELTEFFEEFPKAKVSEACQRLSIHPRLLERRMLELGLSAVKLKRACMLSRASHEILWSNRSFSEIAQSCGYSHGAHLSHAVHCATGGMSPSILRSIVRCEPKTFAGKI